MFTCRIDENLKLHLLEERHAEQIHALFIQNVAHLQVELPWLDETLSLMGAQEYIKAGLDRFADNNGLRAGI